MNVLDKLKNQVYHNLELPLEGSDEKVTIKVRKPSLVKMAGEGQIPNHLLGIANDLILGEDKGKKKKDIKDEDKNLAVEYAKMLELYCMATMVEPTYEEAKDFLTDEQMLLIMDYAVGGIKDLENFR